MDDAARTNLYLFRKEMNGMFPRKRSEMDLVGSTMMPSSKKLESNMVIQLDFREL